MTIDSLRAKHTKLIYQSFDYRYRSNQLHISFSFLLTPDIRFSPQIIIEGVDCDRIKSLPQKNLENLIFHLGLAELPSYWKCACPQEISISAGPLSSKQVAFWQNLFIHGLGEFYYTNNIDFTANNFLKIKADDTSNNLVESLPNQHPNQHYEYPYLVPVGGGKDSGLTLGLLNQKQLDYATLVLEPASPAAHQLCQLSNSQQKVTVKRTIDPQLITLNQQGYLNGHTPFSAYLSFLATFISQALGCQQILVANEQSANQANTNYLGLDINHQYSKSFAYEQKFRNYAQNFLGVSTKKSEYLSFLRPLHEIQIAALFSQYQEFFSTFKSCNISQQQDQWCHACPKCLFTFIMLSPFVETEVLTQDIFNHNLYQDKPLLTTALALAGYKAHKPFECVGTYLEVKAALYLTIKRWQKQKPEQNLPFILGKIKPLLLQEQPASAWEKTAQRLLTDWNQDHFLDEKLTTILKKHAATISNL